MRAPTRTETGESEGSPEQPFGESSSPGPGPRHHRGRHRPQTTARALVPAAIPVVAFLLTNLGLVLAGVRPDVTALSRRSGDLWQLLDVRLLRHDLFPSVWHLVSQPPLFNLYGGFLVHLPAGALEPVFVLCTVVLGLALVLCSFGLLIELRVPPPVASAAVTVLVAMSPVVVLYEYWLSYAFPSAVFLVVSAWALARYLRTYRLSFGILFFGAASAVVLINSTYQAPWLIGAAALVLLARLRSWQAVVKVALVPLLVVAFWYGKNAVMFGTFTTSSWFGMNFTRTTVALAPHDQIHRLQHQGTLSPLASKFAFYPVTAYVPRWTSLPHTGVRALDEVHKSNGDANFDNLGYVRLSGEYLSDDLAYIAAEPATYARHVSMAVRLWLLPADQYPYVEPNRHAVAGYTDFYDHVVLWQPEKNLDATLYAVYGHVAPDPSQISWLTVLSGLLTVVGAPWLAWRSRRRDRPFAVTTWYLWGTVLYAVLATSLVEFGENQRFAFELGPLPVLTAVAVVTAAVQAVRSRRAASLRRTAPASASP